MLPISSIKNIVDRHLGNVKKFCQIGFRAIPRFVGGSDEINIFGFKFGIRISFSGQCSSFFGRIQHVFSICPDKKMGRFDAFSIIARMADKQTGRNFPFVEFKRFSMGRIFPSPSSISGGHDCSFPFPASISFFKETLKLFYGFICGHCHFYNPPLCDMTC